MGSPVAGRQYRTRAAVWVGNGAGGAMSAGGIGPLKAAEKKRLSPVSSRLQRAGEGLRHRFAPRGMQELSAHRGNHVLP
jgi:hypothetical protein